MKLSIIIPVYNLEEYISSTIASIQASHFSYDYEILIINDGSTDKSEEKIKKLQSNNSKIRIVTIKNEGVSNARNIGLQMARGEYITFVDGDDEIEPDFYETAIKEIDTGGYDWIQGNFRIIEAGKEYYYQKVCIEEVIEKREIMLKKFCGVGKIIHNNVWGKVYRADLAKSIMFDRNISIAEDQKYIFDVINMSNKIKLLSCDAYRYYQREVSAMHTASDDSLLDQIEVCRYMKEHVEFEDIQTDIEKNEILRWVELYKRNAKEKESVKKYCKELRAFNLKRIRSKFSKKELMIIRFIRYTPRIAASIICLRGKF